MSTIFHATGKRIRELPVLWRWPRQTERASEIFAGNQEFTRLRPVATSRYITECMKRLAKKSKAATVPGPSFTDVFERVVGGGVRVETAILDKNADAAAWATLSVAGVVLLKVEGAVSWHPLQDGPPPRSSPRRLARPPPRSSS